MLQGSPHLQTKLGLLMFLITWLANSPTVASAFLSNPSNISYLTSQVSSHDSDECELIVQGAPYTSFLFSCLYSAQSCLTFIAIYVSISSPYVDSSVCSAGLVFISIHFRKLAVFYYELLKFQQLNF